MPFTVELIPEDVVTNGVLSRYSRYSEGGGWYYPGFSKWVVNHERNARMAIVSRIGGASGPYDGTTETDGFALFWGDHVIGVYADPLEEAFPPSGPEMNWRVHRLQLSDALQARQGEVIDLVREAFRAIGRFSNGDQYAAVNVQFDLPGLKD